MDRTTLAAAIDQTLLKPTVGFAEASRWIDDSRSEHFATLCVAPFLVPLASQKLAGTDTLVCSVVGFPLGFSNTETKVAEAELLVALGCHEIDMVLNVGALLEGEHRFVTDDVRAVVDAVRERSHGPTIVKVILETGCLSEEQVETACSLSVAAGAQYVKTSTGFGPRGASVEDVRIMRAAVGPDIGVKAAGGIRDLDTALKMLEAGASRIGSSSGLEILEALGNR
ncbi:MAG: deoxyribose-phosphate aldolase [Coriobacteriia bacterium]|jgi:deoxyribose-phosphate aldolase|nr:deoxyribose-phosphate aldolase [Coriobacteriia bacterium]